MFCNTKFIANLFLYAALEWNINRQEKAMEICQEAIDRSKFFHVTFFFRKMFKIISH